MAKCKVGITGGIGSGKTYCARIFEHLGIAVYYADDRAKELMRTDITVKNQLIDLLGKDVYDPDGNLQKDYLRRHIFDSSKKRKAVNAIVHPAVGRDYEKWHMEQTGPYTLKEAALLVESGSYKSLDFLIMVQSPKMIRMQRIMTRDGISQSEVKKRMASQSPDADKEAFSNLFINNSGCYPLMEQILTIHRNLIS